MLKNPSYSFLSLLAIWTFLPHTAYAEPAFGSETQITEVDEGSHGVFPRGELNVELFHDPTKSEGRFTMRLSAPGEVAGCARMTKGFVDVSINTQKIIIDIIDPEIKLKKTPRRYGYYECQTTLNRVVLDVPMYRNELIANKVKTISLKSKKYGAFNAANVTVTKEKFELTTSSGRDSMMYTLWFMPFETIILHAPKAKNGQDVTQEILSFARSRGLIPLEDVVDGFQNIPPILDAGYFIDPSGMFRNKLTTPDEMINIGTISPKRTLQGPDGPYGETCDLEIFARLPGRKNR